MNLQLKIELIELKIVALGKALSKAVGELEELKTTAKQPTLPAKRNLKKKRLQEIENYYTGLQLKKEQRKKQRA